MNNRNDWHLLEAEKVTGLLASDMYKGLSDSEAAKRKRRDGDNSVWKVKRTSSFSSVLSTVFDISAFILIICAVTSAMYDRSTETAAIIAILVIGGALRAVTYLKAERVYEKLAYEKIPMMNVIRGGELKNLSSAEAVAGDIIFLRAGDTVPCDGRVLSSSDSVVSERGVSENKKPVHKFDTVIKTSDKSGEVPCEFRSNMLFAGSVVISGNTRMIATATGDDTLISMKHGGVTIEPENKLPMIKKLEDKSKLTGLIMLVCVMLFTLLSVPFGRAEYADVFLCTMAMAVSAMSDFLPTVAYISSAVLIHRLSRGGMRNEKNRKEDISRILSPSKLDKISDTAAVVFSGTSFFKSGRSKISSAYCNGRAHSGVSDGAAHLVGLMLAAGGKNNSLSSGMHYGKKRSVYIALSESAREACREHGKEPDTSAAVLDHMDSSNEASLGYELSTVSVGGEVYALALGGVKEVLSLCSYIECADGNALLTEARLLSVYKACAEAEIGGAGVVALAKKQSPFNRLARIPTLLSDMTFVGFIAISDEAEKGAEENIKYLISSGVTPIIFSDTPDADYYFGNTIGLFDKHTKRTEYGKLTPSDIREAGRHGLIVSFEKNDRLSRAGAYTESTSKIREAFGEDGRSVSFIGREVSDSGAMRSADVAYTATHPTDESVPQILMKGADVALYPGYSHAKKGYGGLAVFVKTLKTAAQMIHNINHASLYLTASQCARFVLIFSSLFIDIPILSPAFIVSLGLIFDFGAILAIAFTENTYENRLDEKLRTYSLYPLISGAVWGILLTLSALSEKLSATVFDIKASEGEYLAVIYATVILTSLLYVFATDRVRKRKLSNAETVFSCLAVFFALSCVFVPAVSTVFGARVPSGKNLLVALSVPIASAAEVGLVIIVRKVYIKIKKRAEEEK